MAVSKMGRKKKYVVNLTDAEVQELKNVIRRKGTSKTVKCRCQVVLDIDEAHGKAFTNEQAAKSNGVSTTTVINTAKKYVEGGVDSVITIKRNVNSDQARRKLDGRAEARLIEIACSPAPEGRARWTLRLLEEQAKIVLDVPVGKNAIGRALKKTNFDLTKTHTGVSHQGKTRSS